MIIGDINIDILENLNQLKDNYDQNLIDCYENTLSELGFECIINLPTREEVIVKRGKNVNKTCYKNHVSTIFISRIIKVKLKEEY